MSLEAYELLKDLGMKYRSEGDAKKLEALASAAVLSSYGALHHAAEEADIDNLEDEETLELATQAINAASQLSDLVETLVPAEHGGVEEVGDVVEEVGYSLSGTPQEVVPPKGAAVKKKAVEYRQSLPTPARPTKKTHRRRG